MNNFVGCTIVGVTVMLMSAERAYAQSSLTLYGITDAGLVYLSKTRNASGGNGGHLLGFTDAGYAPSVFGMSGAEDIGGGMKAEFKLESGINLANGGFNNSNGNIFGRQAYVGVTGGFGEVKAGLQFSPFFNSTFALDPRGLSNFGSLLPILANSVGGTGIFNANAVSYTSPVIGGLQGSAMFAVGGVAGDFQSGRQYSANLNYEWNGLTVNAAFYDGNRGGTLVTAPPTTVGFEGRLIGAAYKIGSLTVKGAFENIKVREGRNDNVYGGGLDYMARPDVDLSGGVWYISDRNDATNHSVMGAVGASYILSRRTTLYAQIGVASNHGLQNLGLSVSGGTTSLTAPTGTTTGANVGILHTF